MTTLPASGSRARWAVTDALTLTGRCLAHLRRQPEQIANGLLVGWRTTGGLGPALGAVGLLLLLRFVLLWIGIYLGLVVRGPGTVGLVQTLEFPIAFLSGLFVAQSSMPPVVATIAEWNPLSATAAAARELFGNPGWGGESWAAQHPVVLAMLWPLVIVAVFVPLSVRRYRNLGS